MLVMIRSSHNLSLDKSCFLAKKESSVSACFNRTFSVYLEELNDLMCVFLQVGFHYFEYDSI